MTFYKKGDKFKILSGYNNRPFSLTFGSHINSMTGGNPGRSVDIPNGKIITYISTANNGYVWFEYNGNEGYTESGELKNLLKNQLIEPIANENTIKEQRLRKLIRNEIKQILKNEGVIKEDDYMSGLGMSNDQLGKIKDTSRDTSKNKISIDHWEADEYVVSIKGIGVVGGTLHKPDAQFVKTWLESSLEDLKKSNGNNIVLKTSGGQYFVIKINNETIGQPIYSSKSQALMLEKWLMTAIDEIQKKDSIKNETNLTKQDKFWMGHVGDKDDFQKPIKDEFIDGKTTYGPWGIMSPESFKQFGVGIGLGKGQWYKKQPDGQWKKIKG